MGSSKNNIHSLSNVNMYLFTACEQGDFQTIKSDLNSVSSSEICLIRDENKASLIHYVCRYGYINILKYFIELKHIDISQLRTEHGATCAHDAAVCDQKEILQYIFHHNKENLSEKLRWTVRDEQGNTPLHLAASYNSLNVVHYLIDDELADPHNKSYNGFQPIHYASEHGHHQCVKILLLKCPDTVNEQTNQLFSPLHLACKSGSLETVQILISNGANFKLKDQNGLNCLHIACRNSHLNIVQWLVEKQNANIDDIDYIHCTPIHYAAASGNENIIYYLLERNTKILSDNYGNTPLHVAAENGHQSVCAILIERGCCSLTAVNLQDLSASDLADISGYPSLANELRLRAKSLSYPSIQLKTASIVRLVIKKRNVPRSDASNQVNEEDLIIPKPSRKNFHNQPLHFLDLENQTKTNSFEQQIQSEDISRNVQSNLRKVRLTNKEDIATTTSNGDDYNHQEGTNGFIPPSSVVAISKSQSNIPEWRRALTQHRRNAPNGTS